MTTKLPFPAAVLSNHLGIVGKTGSGKTNLAKVVVEQLLDRGERVCIFDPTGVWFGLRMKADGKTPSGYKPIIFGGAHADLPLTDKAGAILAEVAGKSSTSIIIDTLRLSVGARTRLFADFAENLLAANKGTLHLVIDEAHLFAPQGKVWDVDSARMVHAANNLVSLGRGLGLIIILISQRPAKVNKDSLSQVEAMIALRLVSPQDRAAIEEWMGRRGDRKKTAEILDSLPGLPTGTGWIWAPELNLLDKASFPKVSTFDVTPKAMAGGVTLPPIDLGAVKKLMEASAAPVEKGTAAMVAGSKLSTPAERKAELAAEYQRGHAEGQRIGYERGKSEGYAEAMASVQASWARVVAAVEPLAAVLPEIMKEGVLLKKMSARAPRPDRANVVTMEPGVNISFQLQDGLRTVTVEKTTSSALPPGELAILTACAQHDEGCDGAQLTILTGYKRSTRDAYVARLAVRGFVERGAGGTVRATDAGRLELGPRFRALPTGDALRQVWLERLPEGERKIFECLTGAYPGWVDRDSMLSATGFKRSTRDAYIGRLAARKLLVTERGKVRASDHLFN